jgi:hypothetical protein
MPLLRIDLRGLFEVSQWRAYGVWTPEAHFVWLQWKKRLWLVVVVVTAVWLTLRLLPA